MDRILPDGRSGGAANPVLCHDLAKVGQSKSPVQYGKNPMKCPTPREAESRAIFVYVLERDDGVSKIGISRNPKRRRGQIAQASPDKISLARTFRVGHVAVHVEAGAKHLLEPLRIRGEWFRCVPGLAALAVEVAISGSLDARACLAAELERRRLAKAAEQLSASRADREKLWIHDAAMRKRWPQFMPQLATSDWDDR
jgi:hypothetical protein